MKRLALALAAAVTVGTGCGSSHHRCANSVTVDWSGGFQTAANARVGCSAANVSAIDLFINDDVSTAVRVPCTQGAAQAVDLPDGTNLFTVEGIDRRSGSDRIAFRAEVNVPFACGDQSVAVTPAQGTLALDYSLPNNACVPNSRIFSAVHDDIANQLAFVDADPTASPLCAPTPAPAPTFILPAGNFTLLGVNEFSQSSGGNGIVGADCTHRTFQISGAQTTTVTPSLVDSHAACF